MIFFIETKVIRPVNVRKQNCTFDLGLREDQKTWIVMALGRGVQTLVAAKYLNKCGLLFWSTDPWFWAAGTSHLLPSDADWQGPLNQMAEAIQRKMEQ